ncbi:hypothetical protein AKO1_002356 [Acrasis kona]|uniref:Uncharacterized protein n=1 Tax=Acrasis kona TaxID=1008807 RepID=A0AAW2YTR0_9EUKA
MIRGAPSGSVVRLPSFVNNFGSNVQKLPETILSVNSVNRLLSDFNAVNEDWSKISNHSKSKDTWDHIKNELTSLLNKNECEKIIKTAGLAGLQAFAITTIRAASSKYIDSYYPEQNEREKIKSMIDFCALGAGAVILICNVPSLTVAGLAQFTVTGISVLASVAIGNSVGDKIPAYMPGLPSNIYNSIKNFLVTSPKISEETTQINNNPRPFITGAHQHGCQGYLWVGTCLGCYSTPASVAFIHENDSNAHTCLCVECAEKYPKSECPQCRQECVDAYNIVSSDQRRECCGQCIYVGVCGVCRGTAPTNDKPHKTASCFGKMTGDDEAVLSLCVEHLCTSGYPIRGCFFTGGECEL